MNKYINKLLILLIIMWFIYPAQALIFNDMLDVDDRIYEKLQEIELKKDKLAENQRLMKLVNRNMFDQGIDTVEISIIKDEEILKTYYFLQGNTKNDMAIITEVTLENPGIKWIFRPTIEQAIDGLDLTADGLLILEQRDRSRLDIIKSVFKGLYLYYSVENENVPDLSEIIRKSNCRKCKKALSLVGLI